jgi:hypothetical protein
MTCGNCGERCCNRCYHVGGWRCIPCAARDVPCPDPECSGTYPGYAEIRRGSHAPTLGVRIGEASHPGPAPGGGPSYESRGGVKRQRTDSVPMRVENFTGTSRFCLPCACCGRGPGPGPRRICLYVDAENEPCFHRTSTTCCGVDAWGACFCHTPIDRAVWRRGRWNPLLGVRIGEASNPGPGTPPYTQCGSNKRQRNIPEPFRIGTVWRGSRLEPDPSLSRHHGPRCDCCGGTIEPHQPRDLQLLRFVVCTYSDASGEKCYHSTANMCCGTDSWGACYCHNPLLRAEHGRRNPQLRRNPPPLGRREGWNPYVGQRIGEARHPGPGLIIELCEVCTVQDGSVHCLSCTRLICKRCADINSVMCRACHEAGPPFDEDCMSRLTDWGRESASAFIPGFLSGSASPQVRDSYNDKVARRIAALQIMCPRGTHLLKYSLEPGEPAQDPFREKHSKSGSRPRCQLCGASWPVKLSSESSSRVEMRPPLPLRCILAWKTTLHTPYTSCTSYSNNAGHILVPLASGKLDKLSARPA